MLYGRGEDEGRFRYREKLSVSRAGDVSRSSSAKIALATIAYLNAQIAAGAAAVQLFDTWCGELSLDEYESFALPAVQQVIAGIYAAKFR